MKKKAIAKSHIDEAPDPELVGAISLEEPGDRGKLSLTEAAKFRYYKDRLANERVFTGLIALDPTPRKVYSRWIVETFIREFPDKEEQEYGTKALRFWEEDASKITVDLEIFHELRKRNIVSGPEADILKFKSFADLWRLTSTYEDEDLKRSDKVDPAEYDKWYEDKEWLVVTPKTHNAACKYGANTRWCTASKDDTRYFDSYSQSGPLIIIINKPENQKWQLHLEEDQWMDEEDDEIEERQQFLDLLPSEVLQSIHQHTSSLVFATEEEKRAAIVNALAGDPEAAESYLRRTGERALGYYLEERGGDLDDIWPDWKEWVRSYIGNPDTDIGERLYDLAVESVHSDKEYWLKDHEGALTEDEEDEILGEAIGQVFDENIDYYMYTVDLAEEAFEYQFGDMVILLKQGSKDIVKFLTNLIFSPDSGVSVNLTPYFPKSTDA